MNGNFTEEDLEIILKALKEVNAYPSLNEVKFFTLQVRIGKISIDEVPEKYREEVKAALGI